MNGASSAYAAAICVVGLAIGGGASGMGSAEGPPETKVDRLFKCYAVHLVELVHAPPSGPFSPPWAGGPSIHWESVQWVIGHRLDKDGSHRPREDAVARLSVAILLEGQMRRGPISTRRFDEYCRPTIDHCLSNYRDCME